MSTTQIIARAKTRQVRMLGVTAADTFVVPAGYGISSIYFDETAGNAITGGLDLGTTLAGTDVVNSFVITASLVGSVSQDLILLRWFSRTANTTIYVGAGSSWNSASLNLCVVLDKIVP